MRKTTLVGATAALALATAAALVGVPHAQAGPGQKPRTLPGGYKHLVVIYEENHSFDNLYGGWGSVNGEPVEGPADATNATQVDQYGVPFGCLQQRDVNLTSPPLSTTCTDPAHGIAASHFGNQTFRIEDYIAAEDKTCPAPGVAAPNGVLKDSPGALRGGCTRDLVHRFYQEQYQLDGGRQDRYMSGSDAVGLTMGYYDTRQLPIYRYLHSPGAPRYVIADHFFQAAFGGSFLNHQWLIAARSPLDTSNGASGALNSILDSNGMVNTYPQYTPTGMVRDAQLTRQCADPAVDNELVACGDFAVNTIQPQSEPHNSSPIRLPAVDDQDYPTIGDRLSEAGISWNWYSGGWDDAVAGHPGPLFQYHHQPFNYFAAYAPGQQGRTHLQDETDFLDAVEAGTLPTVSFVKPYGTENEHPGYASEPDGSDHLVDLLDAITTGPQAGNTLVVVTYDEFGGQWDHVPPPGAGSSTVGVHDAWGPGTRVPALIISRSLSHSGVDHTVYDTTSILATIERSFDLAPLSSRDAAVNDLRHAVALGRSGP
jgi:acid phosphatase